ncbi:MAG: two-component system cell cycle response regulator [Alphaproteobacteria bacterium]|jgi:two-component system cell cycle response regulator
MTGRVLVVDDILPNIKLLEHKLTSEYYEVATATSGFEALSKVKEVAPDIILLDIMMPGMDGYEVCRRLKADPDTAHIPVVMVTALDQPENKIMGLEAGADDFVTKPIDDVALMARVKNLTRLKMMTDELRMRNNTGAHFGIVEEVNNVPIEGNVLIIETVPLIADKIVKNLPKGCIATIESNPNLVIDQLQKQNYSLVIVSLNIKGFDGLRICSMIRASENFRKLSIIATGDSDNNTVFLKALEMGVNDFISRPIDYNELFLRVSSQIKRFYYAEQLRKHVENSVEYAITDPLTNMHNRRFLNMHLEKLCAKSIEERKALSVAIFDIDHFKSINDTYGHDVGDKVLVQFADIVKDSIRNFDLAVRLGGEEFLSVMPETDLAYAAAICERIRGKIHDKQFIISPEKSIHVTCSIGVSTLTDNETEQNLINRADAALYRAKQTGRDRVVIHKRSSKNNPQQNVA